MSNRVAAAMIGTRIDYRPAHGFPCAATRSIDNGLDVVVRRWRAASVSACHWLGHLLVAPNTKPADLCPRADATSRK